MKLTKGTLIFGAVIVGLIAVVVLGVWIASLFGGAGQGETGGTKGNFFSSLFPFGTSSPSGGKNTGAGGTGTGPTGPAPSLRLVSSAPVGGAHFETSGAIRYIERETGHVYETRPEMLDTVRISNTTIPGIQNAVWLGDSTFVIQYLDENKEVRNYLATLASSTPDQALTGKFLSNFTDVFPAPDEKHMLLATRGTSGISVQISDLDEKVKKTVFVSPLRSWTILPSGGDVFVESAPSSGAGYVYKTMSDGSPMKKISGGGTGLMALPRVSSEFIALSTLRNGVATLSIFDNAKNSFTPSPVATLAEKCAWLPGDAPLLFCGVPSSFVDTTIEGWFMGTQTFNDSAWIINPVRGTAQIVRDLSKETGQGIDVIHPEVSPDGKYVMFINKNDLSLWSLALTQ